MRKTTSLCCFQGLAGSGAGGCPLTKQSRGTVAGPEKLVSGLRHHPAAERRLKNGPTILITGIDQESGVRLLDALKGMKVQARLVDHNAEPWVKRLWNSGLVVSAISLL